MSALGDWIVDGGPFAAGQQRLWWERATAAEANDLRQELIDLRALAYDHEKLKGAFTLACQSRDRNRDALENLRKLNASPVGACVIEGHGGHPAWECNRRDAVPPVAGGLRRCPVCLEVLIGPGLVECSLCAGREDAAAKRSADQ
jgi:hypothetical protein